ncbi:hypothetical protein ILP86_00855 [Microbacterium sp. R1]|uniref:hypothetical protein n=1 Tax=Microbacterium sp. R1 TaxID=322686 RepID=UPI0011C9C76A|nr:MULTISPECIES: hypothetical protein [Terrabacteria group]MBE7952861.1 hypothetical protein [Microbacterium sp. R1]TXF80623.1 hypothetical protein FTX54_16445 [Alkalicoccus halolimnae]
MDQEIRELVEQLKQGADELLNAQASAPALLIGDDGTFDLDEWARYVNVMVRMLTAQTARVTGASALVLTDLSNRLEGNASE